jgi:hypothetical protein
VRRSRPAREGGANPRIACGVRKLPAFRSEHYAHRQQHNRADARGTECVPADNQRKSMKSATASVRWCAGRPLSRKGGRVVVRRQCAQEADYDVYRAVGTDEVPIAGEPRSPATSCTGHVYALLPRRRVPPGTSSLPPLAVSQRFKQLNPVWFTVLTFLRL